MLRLPTETWILIASYLPTLREFMRLWVASQKLQSLLPKSDSMFWRALLECFLQSRSIALDSISLSITGSSKFLSKSRKKEKSSLEEFQAIENLFTRRKCSRSGCLKHYEEWMNTATACWYHPGQLKSGMFLSCCRADSFQTPGCKSSFHSGMFHYMLHSFRGIETSSKEQPVRDVGRPASFLPQISASPQSPTRPGGVSTEVAQAAATALPPIHTPR